jgi:hypothetical protein
MQFCSCVDNKPLEFGNEAWIDLGDSPAPAAGPANLISCERFRIQVVLAAIDRRAGKTGNPRHDGEAAPPSSSHLGRREQSPPAFVELASNRIPAISNAVFVDHAPRLRLFVEIRNPGKTSHPDARQKCAIQLLFEAS